MAKDLAYKRVLLKLSGEALMGDADYGIEPAMIARIAGEIKALNGLGVEIAVVIGGGNIFRGAGLAEAGMDRVAADQMGMLATVINSLSMRTHWNNRVSSLASCLHCQSTRFVKTTYEDEPCVIWKRDGSLSLRRGLVIRILRPILRPLYEPVK